MSTTVKTPENQIAVIDEATIRDKIYIIRGQQVMLDFDLAEIYGYETKNFNRQIKNNINKFDDDFRFQLTREEFDDLRCNFFTSNIADNDAASQDSPDDFDGLRSKNLTSNRGGTRYLPYAFTEQGIYMLMTVLKGDIATMQSKALIRIFKKMKDYIANNPTLVGDKALQQLALQTVRNTNDIAEIKADMVKVSDLPDIIRSFGFSKAESEYLILNGETVEAALAYKRIYSRAKLSILVIDDYIGLKTLYLFKDIDPAVKVTVFSDNKGQGLSQTEYNDFHNEYPNIAVDFKQAKGVFHDRYIILDFGTADEKIYHCGASSKDAGKRVTTISELSDTACYKPLINRLLKNPALILK